MARKTPPELGLIIRRARERRGLSQEALAELLGTGVRSVNGWENGHHVPQKLGLIEAALGFHIEPDGRVTYTGILEEATGDAFVSHGLPTLRQELAEALEERRRVNERIAQLVEQAVRENLDVIE